MSDRIQHRLQLPCKLASVIVVLSTLSFSVTVATTGSRRCKAPHGNLCPYIDCSSEPTPRTFHRKSCYFIGEVFRSIPEFCLEDATQLGAKNCCIRSLEKEKLGRYRNLTTLHLQCNFISTLPDQAFENNPMLKEVNLALNQITEVGNGTFEGLTNLKKLNLRHNCLATLPPSTFSSLDNLNLNLDFNQFEVVLPSWLQSVQYFSIAYNKLTEWPQNCLAPKLEKLVLAHNLLTTWRRTNLMKLTGLDLHDNQLTTVDRDAFVGNPALLDIDLANNRLTSLDSSTFDHLHHLETLHLDGNQLHTAHKEWFLHVISNALVSSKETDVIMTSRNPWSCGCENARIQHYLKAIATCSRPMHKVLNITCRESGNLEEHNLVDVALQHCQEMPSKNITCKGVSQVAIGSQPRKMHRTPILSYTMGAISVMIALCVILYVYRRCRKSKSDKNGGSRPSSFATVSSDGDSENHLETGDHHLVELAVDENGYLEPNGVCVVQEPVTGYTDMMSLQEESRRPVFPLNEDSSLSTRYFNVR